MGYAWSCVFFLHLYISRFSNLGWFRPYYRLSVDAYHCIATVPIFLVWNCSASRGNCLSHAIEGPTPKPQMLIAVANQLYPDWSCQYYTLHTVLASYFHLILCLDATILEGCGQRGYSLTSLHNTDKSFHT